VYIFARCNLRYIIASMKMTVCMGCFKAWRARSVLVTNLVELLRNQRDEMGKIPSQEDAYTLAVKAFPGNRVMRNDLRQAHRIAFSYVKPGPRDPRQ
jgi:hypothetical protein